jgi:hypothetical protein
MSILLFYNVMSLIKISSNINLVAYHPDYNSLGSAIPSPFMEY